MPVCLCSEHQKAGIYDTLCWLSFTLSVPVVFSSSHYITKTKESEKLLKCLRVRCSHIPPLATAVWTKYDGERTLL